MSNLLPSLNEMIKNNAELSVNTRKNIINGARKVNDNKNDEDEFISLLNNYVNNKSKYN